MSVHLSDIANFLGISTATVSLALNGSELVNIETRKRVLEVADSLGYIPNSIARSLARKKSSLLGLILPDIENVYYSKLVKHIDDFSRRAGYRLIISISNNSVEEERKTVLAMIANRVEGVIVVPVNVPNHDPDYFQLFQTNHIPFVFSSSLYPSIPAPYVVCDLEGGMYELTKFLVREKDYRHYVLLTGPQDVTSLRPRECGFLRALNEAEGPSCEIIRVDSVDYDATCKATQTHLKDERRADVIMCVNDTMAIGVINVLARNGIDVPNDIAVTGFDDSLFATVSVVTLTTVLQDIKAIAEHSVRMLMKGIAKEPLEDTGLVLPTHIIKRASTEGRIETFT